MSLDLQVVSVAALALFVRILIWSRRERVITARESTPKFVQEVDSNRLAKRNVALPHYRVANENIQIRALSE
jgi:hypothetical protein